MIKLFIMLIFGLIVNCKTQEYPKVKKINITNKVQKKNMTVNLEIETLQGIWAENEYDNALFYIKQDSLYYLEQSDNPIGIKIKNDTLLFLGDVPVNCKVIHFSRDSLWYIDELTSDTTKLHKRRE